MGYAKYHEDDLKLYDDRMYYINASTTPSVLPSYPNKIPKTEYKYFCPFCYSGFITYKNLIDHILVSYGGVHEFVYLNNRKIDSKKQTVKQVLSLKLYSFREDIREVMLFDNMGNTYSFWTQKDKYEYDINSILKSKLYSEIQIDNIDVPVCIKQQLDINAVSIDKIIAGKYLSYLFDEQLSDGKLTLDGYLTYIKMLIYEGAETDLFIEYIEQMNLEKSRKLQEIYYYHYLSIRAIDNVKGIVPKHIYLALFCLLNGEYHKADSILNGIRGHSNDKYGCKLILNLLKNDNLGIAYLKNRYEPFGIIGIIQKILYHFSKYENINSEQLLNELDEIRLFIQYPLVQALVELNDSINHRGILSQESYSLLKELTPLVAIHYCYGIKDTSIKEKILKNMVEIHEKSPLLKEYVFQNDYSWIKERILVSDGDLYKKAVLKQNEALGNVFSKCFIEEFPFDDQIQITPLGGEPEIGASCFVISYKGYNIMLDCGINVKEYGDSAYPSLDLWKKGIDVIVISHSHIDHSGGVPKAHAMWPEANVITTAPTKVFLKYLYLDMAKVKNGINDEFEIQNVKIEQDVMYDTLNAINTLNFGEWFHLGKDIKIRLHPAGHIIGAAMIELVIADKVLLYTGDYCNYNQFLTRNFDLNSLPHNIDYLITESTYIKNNRVDWNLQLNELKKSILVSLKDKCAVLLPATSVGRSQELVCIIGEMKLSGELPDSIPLYIAGMSIPATTQIVPFMNDRYKEIIGVFKEFDGKTYPEDNAIVIASSSSLSKGSASYCIAKHWDNNYIKYNIIANGYLDEDFEADNSYLDSYYNNVQRVSLPTHTDLEGILDLIEYVSPKVISFVHRGTVFESDIKTLVKICKERFSNDILHRDLKANRCDKIFDMYEYLMEGVLEDE